jgi:aryl-alcohol dehydrogenase-like predicted oxidoreductase
MGASGVKVSTLCLGTMTFGEADANSFMHQVGCDEKTAFDIMDRALDAGINFFDTADVYGHDGLTEKVLGKWFTQGKRRDEVVLATKCRFRMQPGPNGTGASRLHIRQALEASLRRLATDRIDLYQIHMQDMDTPEEETLRALEDLQREGKVLYVGCSNYAAYRLVDSLWIARQHGWAGYVTLQAQYSLVERGLERELVPLCRQWNLGILPWSPLAGGFLTGKFRKDQAPPPGSRLEKWKDRWGRYDSERNWRILEALDAAGRELDATPAQLALAWLLRKPAVSSVIFGARSVAQLEDNLAAARLRISDEWMKRLDEASQFPLGYPYDFMQNIQGRW